MNTVWHVIDLFLLLNFQLKLSFFVPFPPQNFSSDHLNFQDSTPKATQFRPEAFSCRLDLKPSSQQTSTRNFRPKSPPQNGPNHRKGTWTSPRRQTNQVRCERRRPKGPRGRPEDAQAQNHSQIRPPLILPGADPTPEDHLQERPSPLRPESLWSRG